MPLRLHLEKIGLKRNDKWLFRGVSKTLSAGESWAIVGPNGSGKTSFLALIAGYLSPTEGQILLEKDGRPLSGSAFLKRLFWQSPAVHPPPDLRVADVVEDFYRQKGLGEPASFHKRWVTPPQARLYELSSGMTQRLLVGLALQAPEGLILLDEPGAFLDNHYRRVLYEELRRLQGSPHHLLLCATNDPEEIALFPYTLSLPAYAA